MYRKGTGCCKGEANMEQKQLSSQIKEYWEKYKIMVLVLVLGTGLMLVPSVSKESKPEKTESEATVEHKNLQSVLEDALCQVSGAGKVRVFLTESSGEEIIFQENENTANQKDSETLRRETVILSDGQRAQNGLIKQINPPQYQGAVVLCQGADQAAVRLAMVKAVSSLTGLTFDRITVLKMK